MIAHSNTNKKKNKDKIRLTADPTVIEENLIKFFLLINLIHF